MRRRGHPCSRAVVMASRWAHWCRTPKAWWRAASALRRSSRGASLRSSHRAVRFSAACRTALLHEAGGDTVADLPSRVTGGCPGSRLCATLSPYVAGPGGTRRASSAVSSLAQPPQCRARISLRRVMTPAASRPAQPPGRRPGHPGRTGRWCRRERGGGGRRWRRRCTAAGRRRRQAEADVGELDIWEETEQAAGPARFPDAAVRAADQGRGVAGGAQPARPPGVARKVA